MTKKPSKNKQSNTPNPYFKYSGMAFQMLAVILIGLGIGKFLDKQLDTTNIFTAISTVLAVTASIYLSIKDFIKR